MMQRWDFIAAGRFAGMALSAAQANEPVQFLQRGFFTSDDGPALYTFLDSFYSAVLSRGVPLPPEYIGSAFVSIVEGTKVTAIVNSDVEMRTLAKAPVRVGQAVLLDDIVDVAEARFPDYELPSTGAIAYIFQHGWRRGFYFDFTAHSPGAPEDKPLGDVAALLGSLHSALMLRDRIRMDAAVLERMATTGWFPFARLSTAVALKLYRAFENEWDPGESVAQILSEVSPRISEMVEEWASKPSYQPHLDILRDAARLFGRGEHAAAASMVLPKVEGVLRHIYTGNMKNPRSQELRRELLGRVRANVDGYTALLPETFIRYLETYYYARFNLSEGIVPPSRHSFLHGVGPDKQLRDPTFALKLFLTLDQIFFCLSRMKAVP